MTHKNQGFTLIEISIVIVIIALIIGGVMVGRDLIYASEIRKAITQKEKFQTAIATFRNKYGCIPGDCAGATKFGFSSNGNENGKVGEGNDYEGVGFWNQLKDAGLIEWVSHPANPPSTTVFGGDVVYAGVNTPVSNLVPHTWHPGSSTYIGGWGRTNFAEYDFSGQNPSYWITQGGIYPRTHALLLSSSLGGLPGSGSHVTIKAMDAYALDQKIDDGKPLTGSVIAYHAWGSIEIRANVFYSCSSNNAYTLTGAANAICSQVAFLGGLAL